MAAGYGGKQSQNSPQCRERGTVHGGYKNVVKAVVGEACID